MDPTVTGNEGINLTNFADRLPAEIIENILRHFVIEDLRDISLCSRTWRARTIPVLFRFMDARKMSQTALHFHEDNANSQKLLDRCTHLSLSLSLISASISTQEGARSRIYLLLNLVTRMPNLKNISVTCTTPSQYPRVATFLKLLPVRNPSIVVDCRFYGNAPADFWDDLGSIKHVRFDELRLKRAVYPVVHSVLDKWSPFGQLHLTDCLKRRPAHAVTGSSLWFLDITLLYAHKNINEDLNLSEALFLAQESRSTIRDLSIEVCQSSLSVPLLEGYLRSLDMHYPCLRRLFLGVQTAEVCGIDHFSVAAVLRVLEAPALDNLDITAWWPASSLPLKAFMSRHKLITNCDLQVVGRCNSDSDLYQVESMEIDCLRETFPGVTITISLITWPWKAVETSDIHSLHRFISRQAPHLYQIHMPCVARTSLTSFGTLDRVTSTTLNSITFSVQNIDDNRLAIALLQSLEAPCLTTFWFCMREWTPEACPGFLREICNVLAISKFPSLSVLRGSIRNEDGWDYDPHSTIRDSLLKAARKAGVGYSGLRWQTTGEEYIEENDW